MAQESVDSVRPVKPWQILTLARGYARVGWSRTQGPQSMGEEGGQASVRINRNLEEQLWLSRGCESIKCNRIICEDEGNSEVIQVIIMHIFVTKYLLETRSRNELGIKADSMLCQYHCNLNFPFLPKAWDFSFLNSHQANLHFIEIILIYIKTFQEVTINFYYRKNEDISVSVDKAEKGFYWKQMKLLQEFPGRLRKKSVGTSRHNGGSGRQDHGQDDTVDSALGKNTVAYTRPWAPQLYHCWAQHRALLRHNC